MSRRPPWRLVVYVYVTFAAAALLARPGTSGDCIGGCECGTCGLQVQIASPLNDTWVPSWEPVSVDVNISGPGLISAQVLETHVLCVDLRTVDKQCGPLGANVPVLLADLMPGEWQEVEATIERKAPDLLSAAKVDDGDWPGSGGSVVSRAAARFFAAYSAEDPWGRRMLNLREATGRTGITGSCAETEHIEACEEGDDRALRTAFFDVVYTHDVWAKHAPGQVSSGSGSTLDFTRNIRRALEEVIDDCAVRRMLDVPCGDMTWMQAVDLKGAEYIGADVSQVVLERNAERFPGTRFLHLDLVSQGVPRELGRFDLVLVRDLMYHLTPEDNARVLRHLEGSSARLVMLSTYLRADENRRADFWLVAGHKINLFREPYCLRPPDRLFPDGEADRYMGLWDLTAGRGLRRQGSGTGDVRACEPPEVA